MAQKAQVLDIGSYSAKSVATRIPFVGYGVAGATEQICASAREPKTRRTDQAKAVRELLPGKKVAGDAVTVVMPAERVLNRFLEMPFAERAKIDAVLAYELENHVPLAADEFLCDYVILKKKKEGADLFVSLIPTRDVDEFQEAFAQYNIDPRVLIHQAVANARLAELLTEPAADRVAFIDVGHRKTVITIVEDGRFAGTRVVLHGGYELTRTLAERFDQSMDLAEQEKHAAHLFPAGDGLAVGRVQETADCLREGLGPLVRDLNQTFKALGSVEEIYIFGGTARLNGLDQHLSKVLGKPITILRPSLLKIGSGLEDDQLQYISAVAAGLASHKGSDAQRINLRQGIFAYIGDFRFMRGRLIYLTAVLVMMLAAFVAPQVMRYRAVLELEQQLQAEFGRLSMKILGEELEDWDEILGRLEDMPSAEVWTVFPDLSAHEVYWEIADIVARIDGQPTGELIAPPLPEEKADEAAPVLPPGVPPGPDSPAPPPLDGSVPPPDVAPEELLPAGPVEAVHHLDMNQVRIDGASRTSIGGGSVEFTGNASSVATMELYLSMLGKHPCFNSVQRTKQEMLKATAGKEGWWRFTVEFNVSCPRKAAEEMAKEKGTEATKEEGEEGKEKKDGKLPDDDKPKLKEKKAAKPGDPAKASKLPIEGKDKLEKREMPATKQPAQKPPRPRPDKIERENRRDAKRPAGLKPPENERRPMERLDNQPLERESELHNDSRRLNRPIKRNMKSNRPLVPSVPHDRLTRPMGRN
jgi:type IV pilus assembly protein PilM